MAKSKQSRKRRQAKPAASRRTLYDAARLDARLGKVPENFRDLFRDTYITTRKLCAGSPAGETPAGLFELIDDLCGEWAERSGPACAPGCAWCCHQDVLMAPFEFAAVRAAIESGKIADRVRERLADADGGAVTEVDGRCMPVSACPLLENDRCLIYHARPIACRTQFAMDAGPCRRACEAARRGDPDTRYERAGDPAVVGVAARDAVQPSRRIFLRAALRDYLAPAARPVSEF